MVWVCKSEPPGVESWEPQVPGTDVPLQGQSCCTGHRGLSTEPAVPCRAFKEHGWGTCVIQHCWAGGGGGGMIPHLPLTELPHLSPLYVTWMSHSATACCCYYGKNKYPTFIPLKRFPFFPFPRINFFFSVPFTGLCPAFLLQVVWHRCFDHWFPKARLFLYSESLQYTAWQRPSTSS